MTVFANGKPMVFKNGGGKVTTTDVCLTPPLGIPIPFSNVASAADLDNCSQGVFINGQPVAHQKSIFKKTTGDEGGIAGITSATINGTAKFLRGSPDIFVNGIAVVRHGDLVVSNNNNTPSAPFVQPGMEMPPQLKAKYEAQKKVKPTPYIHDVDVNAASLQTLEELCGFTKELAVTNMIGGSGEDEYSNKVTRRVLLRNMAEKQNALALRVPQTEGSGTIDIPLTAHTVTPRNSEQEKTAPAAGQAKTILVACSLAWNTFPPTQKLNVKAGDFTDIARFSDNNRNNIYDELACATPDDLKNKPWDKIIGATITYAIDAEMKQPQALNAGWLYIFKDGFLWREIQVNPANMLGKNTYQDVNLLKYAGSNERKATGHAVPQVILPYKVDGAEAKLEIAYSPVQWSWARINYFGGMDKDDPRTKDRKTKIQMPSDLPKPKQGSAGSPEANRHARMVKLDLSLFIKPDAQPDKTISGDSDNPTIKLFTGNMIPTILVNDPMGLVGRLTSDISAQQVQLQQTLLSLTAKQSDKPSYFHSALLTNQTFFNDKLAFNQSGVSDQDAAAMADIDNANTDNIYAGNDNLIGMQKTADDEAQPTLFKQAQKELDRDKLEKILKVKERASLRALIKHLQSASIKMVNAEDKANWYATPSSFQSSFTDLMSSGDYSYFTALATLSGILNTTTFDPRGLDHNFDVNLDKEPEYTPPGIALSQAISQQSNLFGKLLFPNSDDEEQFDDLIKKDPQMSQHIAAVDLEKHDAGDGSFNLSAHLATFNGIMGYLPNDQTLGLLSSVITTLIVILERHDPTPDKKVFNFIRSYLKVTGIATFSELQVSKGKLVSADHEVLGVEYEKVNTYIERYSKSSTDTNSKQVDPSVKSINLCTDTKDQTGQVNRKVLHRFDAQSFQKNSGADIKTIQVSTFETETEFRTEVIGKIEKSVFSLKKAVAKYALTSFEVSNKFIAPILGAMQVMNLTTIDSEVKQLQIKGSHAASINKKLVFVKDILYITYAIEQTYIAFRGKEEVNKLYSLLFDAKLSSVDKFRNIAKSLVKSRLTPFAMSGCIASAISLGLAAESLYFDIKNKNTDYIMVDALNIFSNLLSLSSIGLAYVESEAAMAALEITAECLGLAGAILSVVAMVYFAKANQSEMVKWADNCPFSKYKPNTDSDTVTVQKLITLLSEPQVNVNPLSYGDRTDPSKRAVMVEVNLPYFKVDQTQLVVQTTWQKQYVDLSVEPNVDNQQFILPHWIEQVMQGDKVVGMRYYYTNLDVGDMNPMRSAIVGTTMTPVIQYRTRVRLQTTDGKLSIPYTDTPVTMATSGNGISSTDEGWIYAEG